MKRQPELGVIDWQRWRMAVQADLSLTEKLDLARLCGVHVASLRRWLHGTAHCGRLKYPSAEAFLLLCRARGLNAMEFFR